MLEVDVLSALLETLAHPCNMGIEVLPLLELLAAVAARVALPVDLAHVLPQLRLLLEKTVQIWIL